MPDGRKVQRILDAVEAARIGPVEAVAVALELVAFAEQAHLTTLEDLLGEEEADGEGIMLWAADAARLQNCREQLVQVMGLDQDADDEDGDEEEDEYEGPEDDEEEGDPVEEE